MNDEFEFEEQPRGRYLILSDPKQEFPANPLKVVKVEQRKKGEVSYPVLTLQDIKTGAEFQCCAFSRDVAKCVSEYGKKPSNWGTVRFVQAGNGNRRELIPAQEEVVEELIH